MSSPDEVKAAARVAFDVVFIDGATAGDPLEVRVDAALEARDAVLAAAGYLVIPEAAPSGDVLDRAARRLAELSEFPRFVNRDGWKQLRRRQILVAVAARKAREHLAPGMDDVAQEITTAETMLKKWAEDRVEVGS